MKPKKLLLLVVFACPFIIAAQSRDTVTYLYQPFSGDSAYLKIKKGKYIVVYKGGEAKYDGVNDVDTLDMAAGPMCPTVDPAQKCATNVFEGCIRGNVKTTMLTKQPDRFKTVAELLAVLPGTAAMKSKGISSGEASSRDIVENRNVLVETAYLFAIYKEDDNDYHMIVGSTSSLTTAVLMNIEISGLPRSATAAIKTKFKSTRAKIENTSYLKNIPCKPSPIKLLGTPIVLKNIKGSLFWDSQHSGGGIGPPSASPRSAWEIHPVIDLNVTGPAA